METGKVLSALSYFSIFFAAIILPLIVWIVAEDMMAKEHAKKAFFSHLILLIPIPLIVFTAIFELSGNLESIPIMFIISIIGTVVLSLIVMVWNIVKGIQVLSGSIH